MKTESQWSFHLLPSLPSHLSVPGLPRPLALSHNTAGTHGQSLALARILKHTHTHTQKSDYISTHTVTCFATSCIWNHSKLHTEGCFCKQEMLLRSSSFLYDSIHFVSSWFPRDNSNNLGSGRCAWQSAGCCFWAALRRYAGTRGSKVKCSRGDDASAAPPSHLLPLKQQIVYNGNKLMHYSY